MPVESVMLAVIRTMFWSVEALTWLELFCVKASRPLSSSAIGALGRPLSPNRSRTAEMTPVIRRTESAIRSESKVRKRS